MNRNPHTIGYWARVNDLKYEDVADDQELTGWMSDPIDRADFEAGWKTADDELKAEALQRLKNAMKEVG